MKKYASEVGNTYKYMHITAILKTRYKGHIMCSATCTCGNVIEVPVNKIISGNTKSCGCWKVERRIKDNTTHNMSKTSEYSIRRAMINRCTNIKDKGFHRYGQRGITVCPRWLESFENFISDMGFRPSAKYSLDRLDNSKGYYKANCAWKLIEAQANNRSNNRKIEYSGITLGACQWARKTGIPRKTITTRLDHLNWSIGQALGFENNPATNAVKYKVNTLNLTFADWSKKLGVPSNTLRSRYRRHKPDLSKVFY